MKRYEFSPLGRAIGGYNLARPIYQDEIELMDIPSQDFVENQDPNKSLFDIVFSVDPRTNLPVGDLSIWMSDKVSPEVKRYIEMNLHSPVSIDADGSGEYRNLSDDDIATFTRSSDESISDYRSRLFDFVKSNQAQELAKQRLVDSE